MGCRHSRTLHRVIVTIRPRFTRSTIKPTTRDNQAVALLDNPGVASRDRKDKHYKPPYSSRIPFDIGLLPTDD
jgi:hypothetical protein